jgi:5'-deoxynucleotidase YfbR-like HD superfamily hydrolase
MKPIFTELDHRLSVVPRWSVLHTIQKQSVAEHCFNVERLATRIAKDWFGITRIDELYELSQYALNHDNLEAVMGDPPTMVKPYIDEAGMVEDHQDLIPKPVISANLRPIVKLADLLEGYHFICVERLLGNRFVENHYQSYQAEISNYIMEHSGFPQPFEVWRAFVWPLMQHMSNDISERHSKRGR